MKEKIDVSIIQNSVRNSQVSKPLYDEQRWTRFKTNQTKAEWLQILGPTAVVISHQEHFTNFIRNWGSNLEINTLNALIIASTIHDMGEAIKGDISNPEKTKQIENEEYIAGIKAIQQLSLDSETIDILQNHYIQIVAGESQILHQIFKAFERTEYLDTAIQLHQKLKNGNHHMEKGGLLISRVLAFDLPKVINYAYNLPGTIGEYLTYYESTITQMFDSYPKYLTPDYIEDFQDSKNSWLTYISRKTHTTL